LSAIGMDNCIFRILPALVAVAFGAACRIFQQPITVAIAQLVAPAQGGSGRPEMGLEQLLIAGPAPGMPEGETIECRRIMGPIVRRGKRDAVAARKVPPAALVQQLPG